MFRNLLNFIYPDRDFDLTKFSTESSRVEDPFDEEYHRSLSWLLKKVDIPYKLNFFSDGISQDNKYYFPINFGNHGWDFLKNFTGWDIIRENENISLLIYYAAESIIWSSYTGEKSWFFELVYYLCKNNIPYEKVKFICGDIDAKNNSKIKKGVFSKIDFLGINIFELIHHHNHKVAHLPKAITEKKEFLCLNNRMRYNRQYLLYYLKKYNIFKNGLVSALDWQVHTPSLTNHMEIQINETSYLDFLDFSTRALNRKEKIKISTEKNINNVDYSYHEHYENTKYSLVTETFVGNFAGKFITEKTYKPITMGHPFIIFGPTGILKELREDGYETFPEIFDESYDDFTTPAKQLEIILNNIKEPKIITKEILEKCERNKENFLKKSTSKKIRNRLKEFL